ncbi:cupredoxin domain-containing protein [Bacillus canaveralius]|uniref:Cupredoxin domain-containing protein n=1 Tax=Bacillus canaveralius TaxID=1403243 RepID=A0A2N5GL36_9BACI|nr:cupredoxin domain-containing protein [Bacillus canaveralius]PLR82190.1 cupredoxin domain-containing protein [Bacillus canaveralius]PLR97904.1 cupredoxin domain-containing protein [Bacillus canaveralius]
MQKGTIKTFTLGMIFTAIIIAAIIPIGLNIADGVGSEDKESGTRMEISMAGFNPSIIRAKLGEEITLQLVNPDNSAHSDGGGWHQFASDELNFDYKLAPETSKTVTLKFDKAGEYEFYCDICCGGRKNPSMQGKIIVT